MVCIFVYSRSDVRHNEGTAVFRMPAAVAPDPQTYLHQALEQEDQGEGTKITLYWSIVYDYATRYFYCKLKLKNKI